MELFLDAIKLLLAPDTVKNGMRLVDYIREKPEWKKDICTIEVHLEKQYPELARFIRGLITEKMVILGYPEEAVSAFIAASTELIENAFEHGFKIPTIFSFKKQKIKISSEMTKHHIALSVENPKNNKFNALNALNKRILSLKKSPKQHRGRGLVLVSELSDSFERTENNCGVKIVFYFDRVSINVIEANEAVLIKINAGLHNPSCARRIRAIALRYKHKNAIIIDFSKFNLSHSKIVTKTMSALFLLDIGLSKYNKTLIVIKQNNEFQLEGLNKAFYNKNEFASLNEALQVFNLEHLKNKFL